MGGQTLNQQVITWARGQLGKQVDAGECWDLANRALLRAGASSSADLGPMGDDADYIWGDPVDNKDTIPGDIVQYRDYVMTTTTTTEVTFADGSGWTETQTATVERPHHTAIISANGGNGAMTVLEQNAEGNKDKVRSTAMRWKDAASTRTTASRRMQRKDNGRWETARLIVTVDVSVSGSVTAYRPTPKSP